MLANARQCVVFVAVILLLNCAAQPAVNNTTPHTPGIASGARREITLRRQPSSVREGEAANFWNITIRPDGSVRVAAEGTPLLADGNYAGVLDERLLRRITTQVDRLKAIEAPLWLCQHAPEFHVYEIPSGFVCTACMSDVERSPLADLYLLATDVLKTTHWTVRAARTGE